jgi:beta-glucanase (GH16 family)
MENDLFKLSFHRFATSALCCACASVFLTACGGGSSAPGAAADTTQAQVSAGETITSNTASSAAQTSGPYGQDASKYTLTFSDEFDNYNSSVWNDTVWYESPNSTKNYTTEGGSLKIWPQRDASGKFFNRTIDTDGKYYQTYGYFEIEAKLPNGKGTWPAFWLLNHDDPARDRHSRSLFRWRRK